MRYPITTPVVLLLATLSTPALAADHPLTIRLDGAASVQKAAESRRVHLLGIVELYSLAVYVDGSLVDRTRLASSDVPKALRIAVSYQEDLRRHIALDWRRELVPQIDRPAAAHLHSTFAPLTRGDVVLIAYTPGRGTSVQVNDRSAVTGANHDLMLAFLDHWVGQRPVSDEMKRVLLTGSDDIR
jgi:hypothetical protein